jgi:ACS family tartrate transporter-like MFS transporter
MLVMIPHLVGGVAMVLVSLSSDRRLERRYHTGIPVLLGGVALLLMGVFHSTFALITLLSLLAVAAYAWTGPFFALPSEFLTGSAAAAGIGLINSVGNLGGFVGPYTMGVMSGWTGGVYGGLVLMGIPMLLSATGLIILPKRSSSVAADCSHGVNACKVATSVSSATECFSGRAR